MGKKKTLALFVEVFDGETLIHNVKISPIDKNHNPFNLTIQQYEQGEMVSEKSGTISGHPFTCFDAAAKIIGDYVKEMPEIPRYRINIKYRRD